MTKLTANTSSKKEADIFSEVQHHVQIGFDETDKRATGKNRIGSISFDEADELFRSWLDEQNWPYDALLFDPRVFTFIFEKTARLLANKLRGRLIPREGSDVLAAHVNNELLSYQWDKATHGGTMLAKWAMMDLNTRKYGSAFSLCKWRYELGKNDRLLFDGPEMKSLNNRDCAHDLSATSIEDCNWFQVRDYITLNEFNSVNDRARTKPIYKNLDKLREAIGREDDLRGGDTRGANWHSRSRTIAGLEPDPVGKDFVFKTVEIVTEYRRDKWITIAPKHGVVLREIENPYQNNEIPIVMLRYYAIDDDLYGLSEIEPVKSIQKAINALLSQYVDEMNQKLYSPVAVGPGVRQHTLEWGKGARWVMNNPMTDFRVVETGANAISFFQSTYSVLVSAMMSALGETSLGISNIQPFQGDKTATEVRAVVQQRNARDNLNQNFLAEAIERQMRLWYSMNQLMLFADKKTRHQIVRIVGKDAIKFFKEAGLNEMTIDENKAKEALSTETSLMQEGIPKEQRPSVEDMVSVPRFPINIGTEKEPKFVTKLKPDNFGEGADLYVTPDDLKGDFDFIADVESMSLNTPDTIRQARQTAVTTLITNPMVLQYLQAEGVKPKFKDLFVTWLEDVGFKDAEKFFESAPVGQTKTPQQDGAGLPGQLSAMLGQAGQAPQGMPTQIPAIPEGNNQLAKEQQSPFTQINLGQV